MRLFKRASAILAAVLLVSACVAVPAPEPMGRSVYLPSDIIQVTGNGKYMTFPSGSALTIEAGATASVASALAVSGAQSNTNYVNITAPTAVATAQPALKVNSAGVSNLLEVQDGGAAVLQVFNGGGVKVSAPTAIATAVPALVVDSAGVSNLLSVRKNATPVFAVAGSGTVTGLVLQYGTSGKKVVCDTATITGTGTLPHGLATPQVVLVSLASDATGDGRSVSSTNSGGTVTGKVWSSALTPAAATTPVSVDWCVVGTP